MQAIEKELRRSGQVYYIHNRIDSIYSCAEKIRSLIPEARVGVAHGKMTEEQMLEIWRQLLDGSLDVLVCTTIIETGVDVFHVPARQGAVRDLSETPGRDKGVHPVRQRIPDSPP